MAGVPVVAPAAETGTDAAPEIVVRFKASEMAREQGPSLPQRRSRVRVDLYARHPGPERCLPAAATGRIDLDGHQVGLVLSGGVSKGLAFIGALAFLEDVGLRVDGIVGTSMGAVVGAMYAVGYSPDEMARIVVDEVHWETMFTDLPEPGLLGPNQVAVWGFEPRGDFLPRLYQGGLRSGQNVYRFLNRYLMRGTAAAGNCFDNLYVPFRPVVTEVDAALDSPITRGNLANYVRASLSYPALFTPVYIGGKQYRDGGMLKNFALDRLNYVIGYDPAETPGLPPPDPAPPAYPILLGIDVSDTAGPTPGLPPFTSFSSLLQAATGAADGFSAAITRETKRQKARFKGRKCGADELLSSSGEAGQGQCLLEVPIKQVGGFLDFNSAKIRTFINVGYMLTLDRFCQIVGGPGAGIEAFRSLPGCRRARGVAEIVEENLPGTEVKKKPRRLPPYLTDCSLEALRSEEPCSIAPGEGWQPEIEEVRQAVAAMAERVPDRYRAWSPLSERLRRAGAAAPPHGQDLDRRFTGIIRNAKNALDAPDLVVVPWTEHDPGAGESVFEGMRLDLPHDPSLPPTFRVDGALPEGATRLDPEDERIHRFRLFLSAADVMAATSDPVPVVEEAFSYIGSARVVMGAEADTVTVYTKSYAVERVRFETDFTAPKRAERARVAFFGYGPRQRLDAERELAETYAVSGARPDAATRTPPPARFNTDRGQGRYNTYTWKEDLVDTLRGPPPPGGDMQSMVDDAVSLYYAEGNTEHVRLEAVGRGELILSEKTMGRRRGALSLDWNVNRNTGHAFVAKHTLFWGRKTVVTDFAALSPTEHREGFKPGWYGRTNFTLIRGTKPRFPFADVSIRPEYGVRPVVVRGRHGVAEGRYRVAGARAVAGFGVSQNYVMVDYHRVGHLGVDPASQSLLDATWAAPGATAALGPEYHLHARLGGKAPGIDRLGDLTAQTYTHTAFGYLRAGGREFFETHISGSQDFSGGWVRMDFAMLSNTVGKAQEKVWPIQPIFYLKGPPPPVDEMFSLGGYYPLADAGVMGENRFDFMGLGYNEVWGNYAAVADVAYKLSFLDELKLFHPGFRNDVALVFDIAQVGLPTSKPERYTGLGVNAASAWPVINTLQPRLSVALGWLTNPYNAFRAYFSFDLRV